MVVCHCKAVNDTSINELLAGGRLTLDDVAAHCGAGTDCGGCLDTIEDLLDAADRASRPAA
ncbi:MAG: (2Fe-2S)-binding protein [Actinomycetota bacterium]